VRFNVYVFLAFDRNDGSYQAYARLTLAAARSMRRYISDLGWKTGPISKVSCGLTMKVDPEVSK
jgi:hypothetical protein